MLKLNSRVTIIELKRPGRINALFTDSGGTSYRVRYFYDGIARDVYFQKDELKLLKGN